MFIKKTRSELKEMVLGWKDKTMDFIKKQEAWKVLLGGIFLGGALVLLIGIVLPILFLLVVIAACLYFMEPEDVVDVEVNDANKDNK